MKVRKNDLKTLSNHINAKHSQLVLAYGHKESSLEATIDEFFSENTGFYYDAVQASEGEQRIILEKAYKEIVGDEFELPEFADKDPYSKQSSVDYFKAYIRDIFNCLPEKKILVINDANYIARKEKGFLPAIAEIVSEDLCNALIILAFSDVVWFEENIDANSAELKAAKPEIIKYDEWRFVDVAQAFPEYPVDELIRLYGIFGGYYSYLEKIDVNKSVRDNVIELFVAPGGALHDFPQLFLNRHLREVAVYNSILSRIACGNHKLNDIFAATGFSRAKISVYMKNLAKFGVVEKVESIATGGWENTKKGVYTISNTFLHFYFKFIYTNISQLKQISPAEFYEKHIAPEFDSYMEHYFTKVCAEYIELMNMLGQLPIKVKRIGTWVGKQGSIDILAQSEDRQRIVARCSWSKELMTIDMLTSLIEATNKAKIKSDYYYLFSAHGFSQELIDGEKAQPKMRLIDLNDF